MKVNENIKKKLQYLSLDLNKIPDSIKEFEPLNFRPSRIYTETKHRQYRYVSVKEIEILLSPTNRLDTDEDKYSKASPLHTYLIPDTEENFIKHTTFLNMIKKMSIEDIEEIEEEQKELNKNIPFKVKYPGNYLWQIYYSDEADKYFMIVPTEDSDYSTFFFLLKKKLEKKKGGKIFVPICHVDYSRRFLKKSEIEDLENYLWLFTKDWPFIYEITDKNDQMYMQIVGETEVYGKVKTAYTVKLKTPDDANRFYKLIKALFILQTELPHRYKFTTNINSDAEIEFFDENKKMVYEDLAEYIKEQILLFDELKWKTMDEVGRLRDKLKILKEIAVKFEFEYVEKEKQISTFLACKRTFLGKVKYFIKFKKSKTLNEEIEENKKYDKILNEDYTKKIVVKNVKEKVNKSEVKDFYTIEELIETYRKYEIHEIELKNIVMDINALKLKNKNMKKKIENASQYIEEIDKHKKSIFDFWKYSNKDEVAALTEGEKEISESTNQIKITRAFDYEEDVEKFGNTMDKLIRNDLSQDEKDSIYISIAENISLLNKLRNKEESKEEVKEEIKENLKKLKEELKIEKKLLEKDEFNIFGGLSEDSRKIKFLDNKKHRELPKDKFNILDINSKTTISEYTKALETVIDNIGKGFDKITSKEDDLYIYKAIPDENLAENNFNIFNINPELEINENIGECKNKLNLYKITLKKGQNIIPFTNSIFYDNQNGTLPIGMNLSTKVLIDNSKLNLKLKNKHSFKMVKFEDEKNDLSKADVKTVNVFEYEIK